MSEWIIENAWDIISIAVSASVGLLVFYLDRKRRIKEEVHARKTVIENLSECSRIFVELTKTARRPESEQMEAEVLSDIDFFFQENHEKIRDIIRFTKIYLNEWKNLSADDKIKVDQALNDMSWLLTDFYPIHKPDLIKQGKAIQNRSVLSEKSNEVAKILSQIKTNKK